MIKAGFPDCSLGGSFATSLLLLRSDLGLLLRVAIGDCAIDLDTLESNETTLLHGVGDHTAHQLTGTNRVVVAGDGVVDEVRIAVRVDHSNDRHTDFASLGDRDVLLLGVEDEDRLGQTLHVADSPEVALEFRQFTGDEQRFLLGHCFKLARVAHSLVFLHLADTLRDGLEVGEHAAQPAFVDIGHVASLRVGLDRILRLLLGPDEQHRSTVRYEIANEDVRLLKMTESLMQIHDVDP